MLQRIAIPLLPWKPARSRVDVLLSIIGPALLVGIVAGTWFLTADYGGALTRNTVRLALSWYLLAISLMLYLQPRDWAAVTDRGRLARWCWTWAVVNFLVHLGMAFHYHHHWSHEHAFVHTRRISGVGEGIYVSYLFTVLWAADAIAWWLWPEARATRTAWIGRTLHGFMLFIVFNGTVIYESGPIRWVASVAFVALAAQWWLSRRDARSPQAAHVATQIGAQT